LVFLASVASLLVSAPSAQAQIVADPYAKSGPADEEREFIASHTGQPNAPETLATLKELYAAAAKFYATDADGHLYLRYTATGSDGGSGTTGVPLTWTAFGKGIKAGQIVLIRLTETPTANASPTDKTASPPPPQVIEYTVRWLPEQAATPDTASTSPATSPVDATTIADVHSSKDAAGSNKKLAADVVAYGAIIHVQEGVFLKLHGGFRFTFTELDAAAKKVTAESGDPTPGDVKAFLDLLDTAIKDLEIIGGRDLQTGTARNIRGQIQESQVSKDSALKMDRQLEDMKNADLPPPPPKSDF
jgi:hypothetical protein